MTAFVVEQGPEAAATIARLTDHRFMLAGEGVAVSVGTDGPTACCVSHGGTLLDLLAEDDVDELEWRRATRVRRFSSHDERDAYVAGQRVGRAVDGDPAAPAGGALADAAFDLRLTAGLTDSEVRVQAVSRSGVAGAKVDIRLPDRRPVRRGVRIAADEWARFRAELSLLRLESWTEYPVLATDGLAWSLRYVSQVDKVRSAGVNSYPPDGSLEPTQEFVRLLLACERLVGRELWPGFDVGAALDDVPDERDATEHLILHAIRAWAAECEEAGQDPATLRESMFERALAAQLRRLTAVRTQVAIRGRLAAWPRIGPLDIELGETTPPVWLELKWARQAGTLFNCLWDTGKLAQAVRETQARQGYLIAGAPIAAWREPTPYRDLLAVSVHAGDALVAGHPAEWLGWQTENPATFPISLPCPVFATRVGHVDLHAGGEPWRIVVARVEAPGHATYDPSAVLARGRRGLPG
ncbi:hypothetical protein [Capillimicrobium parvum]|uniref:Uncharacterized protein n=1 Tax=Capillimicrobium parvum TaxID=2884022 RepID=A0A9E6Y2E6_9ACTN|nr:hypothetical protein [Capillimicrobium parvum]UGS38795.1 hypothetical protein DSM104329_05225 [Capillimicrobium parvum]